MFNTTERVNDVVDLTDCEPEASRPNTPRRNSPSVNCHAWRCLRWNAM